MTEAEKILWEALRNRKLIGAKFRRQHPISVFILDFYCHEYKLVVEIDGGVHEDVEVKEYDKGREEELRELKLKVIRFKNEEVMENLKEVLEQIKKYLTPGPSP